METLHIVALYCPACGKGYLSFNPRDNRLVDTCISCSKVYTIDTNSIPAGQGIYVFEKESQK